MISLLLLIAASLSATNAIYCPVGWKVTYGPRSPDRPDYIVPKCVPSGFKPPKPLNTLVPPKASTTLPKPPAPQKSAGLTLTHLCPMGEIPVIKTVTILGKSMKIVGCEPVLPGGFVPPKKQENSPADGPVEKMKAKYDAQKAKLEKAKQKLLAVLKKLIEKKKQLLAETDTSVQSGSQGFSGILGQILSKLDAETQKLLAECKTLDEALAKLEELKAKASVTSGSQGFDPFLTNFMAQLDEETRKFLSDAKTLDEALAKLEQLKAGAFVPPNQRSAGFCPPGKKWGLKNTIILGRVVPLPGCV